MIKINNKRQRILTNADPGLLALAFAVSIAEPHPAKIIPAANESFEQNHIQLLTNSKNKRNWLIIIMIVKRLESVF